MARCWLPNAQASGAGSTSGDTAIQIAANHQRLQRCRAPAGSPPRCSSSAASSRSARLSYGDLRTAAQPEKLVSSGTPATPAPDATATDPVLFAIKNGSGHTIPPAIWAYVNGSKTSPGGMLANFGRPLTEAMETTATVDGASHHVLVQPFWYGVVIVDNDAKDDKGQPASLSPPQARTTCARSARRPSRSRRRRPPGATLQPRCWTRPTPASPSARSA